MSKSTKFVHNSYCFCDENAAEFYKEGIGLYHRYQVKKSYCFKKKSYFFIFLPNKFRGFRN